MKIFEYILYILFLYLLKTLVETFDEIQNIIIIIISILLLSATRIESANKCTKVNSTQRTITKLKNLSKDIQAISNVS
jgi:hypothetical protein